MIELTVKTRLSAGMMTREAAALAARMNAYEARVLLRRSDVTVNAKSLMGIVSLGLRDGMSVTVLAEGPDEAAAATEVAAMLGAYTVPAPSYKSMKESAEAKRSRS